MLAAAPQSFHNRHHIKAILDIRTNPIANFVITAYSYRYLLLADIFSSNEKTSPQRREIISCP